MYIPPHSAGSKLNYRNFRSGPPEPRKIHDRNHPKYPRRNRAGLGRQIRLCPFIFTVQLAPPKIRSLLRKIQRSFSPFLSFSLSPLSLSLLQIASTTARDRHLEGGEDHPPAIPQERPPREAPKKGPQERPLHWYMYPVRNSIQTPVHTMLYLRLDMSVTITFEISWQLFNGCSYKMMHLRQLVG